MYLNNNKNIKGHLKPMRSVDVSTLTKYCCTFMKMANLEVISLLFLISASQLYLGQGEMSLRNFKGTLLH